MWQPVLFLACCIPAFVLLAAVSIERWRRQRRGERQPLSEKLLRPPGYSLQRRLEDLNDDSMIWFMAAFVFSALVVLFPQTRPGEVGSPLASLVVFGLIGGFCTVMALRKLFQIRSCRMGLLGEQAVAEQLQPLVVDGYRIFHDLPGGDKWNIDHVAVGPAGVFAIETKYRTKRPGPAGGRDNEAVFEDDKIQFPSGYDTKALKQAADNARWLSNMLTKSVGERISAQPLVVLPGWWVTLKTKSDVKVLSGKQVAGFISTEPSQLSDKLVKQISYQLDQRCRDVEW